MLREESNVTVFFRYLSGISINQSYDKHYQIKKCLQLIISKNRHNFFLISILNSPLTHF